MHFLADGPIPSQPNFPNGRTLVFVLCRIETGARIMIFLLIAMGAYCWVPLILCCPIWSLLLRRFLYRWRSLLLFINNFMTYTSSLFFAASLALLAMSFSTTVFLLMAVVARLSKHPSSAFRPTVLTPLTVITQLFFSKPTPRSRLAALAAPNLSAP